VFTQADSVGNMTVAILGGGLELVFVMVLARLSKGVEDTDHEERTNTVQCSGPFASVSLSYSSVLDGYLCKE